MYIHCRWVLFSTVLTVAFAVVSTMPTNHSMPSCSPSPVLAEQGCIIPCSVTNAGQIEAFAKFFCRHGAD